MTVEPHQASGQQLANPEDFGTTGLEDFGLTDAVIPRIKIAHKDGQWEDNLSGARYDTLRFIILGMVKQRILWHTEVDEGDSPMCKSPDFQTGFPNLDAPVKKSFPWAKSGFDPNSVPTDPESGSKPLPCSSCALKDWGTHPNGSTPYCAEQWTLAILFDPDGDGQTWVPAILSLQKSSIKPIRSFLTAFARTNKPAFTAICEGTLKVSTRGAVDYSTPTFKHAGSTDQENWLEYSQQYLQMRDYLMQKPRSSEEDAPAASTDNSWPSQQQQQSAPQQDPWANQQQTQPPAEDPWANQQQAPQQSAPPPQNQAPPQQQSAPPQQAPQQTPPPQTAPPQNQPEAQSAPPKSDLPF